MSGGRRRPPARAGRTTPRSLGPRSPERRASWSTDRGDDGLRPLLGQPAGADALQRVAGERIAKSWIGELIERVRERTGVLRRHEQTDVLDELGDGADTRRH